MLKDQLAVYELLRDMIKGKTGHISKVTYTPQKPAFPIEEKEQQPLARSTPEEQGVSSRHLASFIRDLVNKEETDIHGVMVLRNGYVIGEYAFAPYKAGVWHIGHSMCKSITGMAIGLLISEGKLSLDDRIVKIFTKRSFLGNMRQKNITVRHLLTMTSRVTFNESGIVSGDDWVKGYLDSGVNGTPGEKFEYNSMNSYMLSAIVTELTGETMTDYLKPRLFEPLGITRIFWECCPKGITKGGWGLFLCQEDAAKLGQLYLQGGKWKERQIIPEDWVKESVKKQVETPVEMGYFGYGYQIWAGGREGSFNFNGMLGQNVVVYPDMNMVIVANAGSNELFQNCVLMSVVRKYFEGDYTPADVLPADPVAEQYLEETARKLRLSRELPAAIRKGGWRRPGRRIAKQDQRTPERTFDQISGKSYLMKSRRAGIFPLVMQVFHNNFTDGIEKLGFISERGKHFLILQEGEDLLEIEIGFDKAASGQICIHREPYLISTKGAFAQNEDGQLVLKLDIAFLEEAVRRRLKIIFKSLDEIQVLFDETPGKELIEEGLGGILQIASKSFPLNNLMDFGNIDLPELLVERTIRPAEEGRRIP